MDPAANTDFEAFPAGAPQRRERLNRFRRLHGIGVRGTDIAEPLRSFSELHGRFGVDPRLLGVLTDLGFVEPTAVQRQALPVLLEGREALVCAPTGSGKTLAFVLPVLEHARRLRAELGKPATPRGLLLSPTVELSVQTFALCQRLAAAVGLVVRMEDCSGGVRRLQLQLQQQEKGGTPEEVTAVRRRLDKKLARLRRVVRGVDVLVSTPKRLLDAVSSGLLRLDAVERLVFDEADRLFDDAHGCLFRDQIAAVFQACSHPRVRRSLFSATTRPDVDAWARLSLDNRVSVRVGRRNAAVPSVVQTLTYCGQEAGKLHEMRMLLVRGLQYPCLVFLQSRERARLLQEEVEARGVLCGLISGDKSQQQREAMVERFRAGELRVLISTDVLGRGVDLPEVRTVVNYDLPPSPLEYVHRVGRTGRAGRSGAAVTFWTDDDFERLRPIAHLVREAGGEVPAQLQAMLQQTRRRPKGRAARSMALPDRGDLKGRGRRRRDGGTCRGPAAKQKRPRRDLGVTSA